MNVRSILHWSACIYTVAALGCGGKPKVVNQAASSPAAVREELAAADEKVYIQDYVEPATFTEELGLHAAIKGEELVISAHNRRATDVMILPKDLALIVGPRNPQDLVFITASVADVAKAGFLTLRPDGIGVLRIPMKTLHVMPGYRLVYNNPRDGIRMSVVVE